MRDPPLDRDAAELFPPELRARFAARDPAAQERFFEVYFDRVYAYVRRLVKDEHLAEDLTQDVFLHVQRGLASYDPARDVGPWLFTIATNKVRDHWRSMRHHHAQREVSLERDELVERRPARQPADAHLGQDELLARLQGAIDELPESMRLTLVLRAFENLSFEEIGRIVERNEVAVRKRYSRAIELLRESLGPAWRAHLEELS